jgi:hypothetical protein
MSIAPNIWPKYSFVQDSSADAASSAYPDPALCLPLSSWTNLQCQVLIDATDPMLEIAASPGVTSKIYLTPVAPDFPCRYDVEVVGLGFSHTHHPVVVDFFSIYDTGPTPGSVYVYLDVPNDSGDMNMTTTANNSIAMPVGACFKFALIWDLYTAGGTLAWRNYFGCTNMFRRTAVNDPYTSVLRYTSTGDVFDFHYSSGTFTPYNSIELPVYLRDPVMENEQKVYTRSDGSLVKLYERKEEVYTLETDLIPYSWHKALDIALSHDVVQITNPNASSFDPLNTATQFVKKENYEIEYNKAPLSAFGKGSCKLSNADAIHLVNNNCG